MLSRERVIEVIEHRRPDRIPIYGWLFRNLEKQIGEVFGSVAAFEDRFEFDFAHVFGGPARYPDGVLDEARRAGGGEILPSALLDIPLSDPDDEDSYARIRLSVRHHRDERGRFVYVQTPGIFEELNGPFGIENHLAYLLLYEKDLHEAYRRQAEWNTRFALNCLECGIDMIHVSDDWGSQKSLLFSTEVFHRLILPYHRGTCRAVKDAGGYLSLHSDGNVMDVLDDIADLGYDVLHPYQESAGMDYSVYRSRYGERFVLMGGLDVQTMIGFGRPRDLEKNIERVMRIFASGGLLYCTTHFVQDHCTMEELEFAYERIYELCRRVCR